MKKHVSFSINRKIKQALVLEVSMRNYFETGSFSHTLNKLVEEIFESFLDKYKDNSSSLKDIILGVLSKSIASEATKKLVKKELGISQGEAYPLKLTDTLIKRLEDFRTDYNANYSLNLDKGLFY